MRVQQSISFFCVVLSSHLYEPTYTTYKLTYNIHEPDAAPDTDTAGARALVSVAWTPASIWSWTAAESTAGPDDVPGTLPVPDPPRSVDTVALVSRSKDHCHQIHVQNVVEEKESSSKHPIQHCWFAWTLIGLPRRGDCACAGCACYTQAPNTSALTYLHLWCPSQGLPPGAAICMGANEGVVNHS